MFAPLLNPVAYAFAGFFALFALVDIVHRARDFDKARHWRLRGLIAFGLYMVVAFYAPLLWDAWLAERSLTDISELPIWAQFAIGLLVFELGVYVWHRTMHQTDFLWRHLHQAHHSAERVDIWGAFYFHPLDMVGFTLVGSLCLVGGLGVGVEAAIAVNIAAGFLSTFSHANIRTPHWLGYIIARPESHAAHHERDVHARNYCELPLWDMLFGTFHNPKAFTGKVGFYEGASSKLWPLLIGRRLV